MKTQRVELIGKFRLVLLAIAPLLLVGCGAYSGGGTNSPSGPTSAPASAVVNISDSPSDRVVAFAVTLNSVTFTRSDNATYSTLNSPRRIEVSHLSETAEPLTLPILPGGIYTTATVDLSAPQVVYVDDSGNLVEKDFPGAVFTLNISLDPKVTIGSQVAILTLNLDVEKSVSIDPTAGNVEINPSASILQGEIPLATSREGDPDEGEIDHVVGQVTAASSNSLSIVLSSGTTLTLAADANTRLESSGNSSVSALPLNSTVRVEAVTRQDGTLLATDIALLSMNGRELEGAIVGLSAAPLTSFDLVLQDGSGSGVSSAALGSTSTVPVTPSTEFILDSGNLNLSGLTLPTFSAASLTPGQRVEAETLSAQDGSTATRVRLEQQALSGTISGASFSQFTLTLPDDSAFKLLSHTNSIVVFTPSNTELKDGVMITDSSTVLVRGLVFFDPATGNYSMVAGRISAP